MTNLFVQQQEFVLFAIKQTVLVLDYLDIPFNNGVLISWNFIFAATKPTYTFTFPISYNVTHPGVIVQAASSFTTYHLSRGTVTVTVDDINAVDNWNIICIGY